MNAATKNESLKCSQQVRAIPLERYRLPDDGRKWRQAARSRSDLLVRLSTYANGDGTFVRNGRNYSPSFETLERHVARKSFYRLTDALHAVGLLSWTRERHYERRVYTIHLPETGVTFAQNQVSDSKITGVSVASEHPNQVSDSREQVPHSPESGVTMDNHPSLPSKEPSKEREPSAEQQPKSSPSNEQVKSKAGGQGKPSSVTPDRVVNYIIEKAKEYDRAASFSGKAKQELREALKELGSARYEEFDDIIREKISQCDDFSIKNFGSSLAAELVGSVRGRRKRIAKAAKAVEDKRLGDKWSSDFRAIWDDVTIDLDAWLDAHPPIGEAQRYGMALDEEAHKYREDLIARAAAEAEPRATAEELFGSPTTAA